MKWYKWAIPSAASLVLMLCSAQAREGSRFWQIQNRVRLEWDDNVHQENSNKDSSFKIIEEAEFHVNLALDNTFVSIRYKPSFVWWENRPGDSTDLHHAVDLVFNQRFSPRLSLNIKDSFRYQERPELIERGTLVQEKSNYYHNDVVSALEIGISPETRMELTGRYVLLAYDDNALSDREDFDLYVAGATLEQQVMPSTAVRGEVRYENADYQDDARDSDSILAGVGAEQTFSPNLLASARAGWQHKELNQAADSSLDSPYADGSLTFLPSPATRLTVGAGYSLYEANVFPFANQERVRLYAGLAQEVTARVGWFTTVSFTHGDYSVSEATTDPTEAPSADGTEDIVQLGTRVTYRINRSNWLEAGWQLISVNSDLREDYDRNRVNIGWKTQI